MDAHRVTANMRDRESTRIEGFLMPLTCLNLNWLHFKY